MNVYIYMQLSASFYLNKYIYIYMCLSSMHAKPYKKHMSNAHIHFQPRKKTSVPPITFFVSKHQTIPISPSWPWLTRREVFPATPPIKECSNLWWKEHPKTLISWRSEVWPGMRQFQSNSHQDPEQKLSPSFLAQQGRDWMLFSLEILSNNRIRVANTFADLVS